MKQQTGGRGSFKGKWYELNKIPFDTLETLQSLRHTLSHYDLHFAHEDTQNVRFVMKSKSFWQPSIYLSNRQNKSRFW